MNRYARHPGFTLSEVLVVVAAMVLLTVLAVPAMKKIVGSFESASGVRKVIAAALSNARAIAAKEQKYAGVRFQQDLNGNQYMIFIIHDPADAPTAADLAIDPYLTGTGLANGFRALDGRKPVKLPASIGVFDLRLVTRTVLANNQVQYSEAPVNADPQVNNLPVFLSECSTFSVVFSPTGRLLLHEVRVRQKHLDVLIGAVDCFDNVFNDQNRFFANDAMFMQDDYFQATSPFRYGPETSRNCFVIYDKKQFEAVPPAQRWTGYLQQLANLDTLYINPHTGELVNN